MWLHNVGGSSKHSILSVVHSIYVELSNSTFSTITIVAVAIVIILNRFTIVSLPIMACFLSGFLLPVPYPGDSGGKLNCMAGSFGRKILWWIAKSMTFGRIYFGG